MLAHQGRPTRARSDAWIRPFIHKSLFRTFSAAPRELADEGRARKPQDFRDPGDHSTWTRSVDRFADYRS
jgi:hypothetical protein